MKQLCRYLSRWSSDARDKSSGFEGKTYHQTQEEMKPLQIVTQWINKVL